MHLINAHSTPPSQGMSLAIGNFDGLHLGHQAVIDEARKFGKVGLLSFHPHPRRFFAPDSEPFELMTAEDMARAATGLNVELYEAEFNHALANSTPEEFVQSVLAQFAPAHITIGDDFAFGKDRAGNAQWLKNRLEHSKIGVSIVPAVIDRETQARISSSAIRAALTSGNPQRAAKFLGKPHSISGIVTKGDQRGRELGFPTANLYPKSVILPKFGIYATRLSIESGAQKGQYLGASSLGVRPSFGVNAPNFETYILDFSHDIYGESIVVELIEYIRPEIAFTSLDELIKHMHKDVEQCRHILTAS